MCESLLSLLWKSRDLEAALPLVSVLQGGRLPSSHRCRKFPVLHRLIYGSCVTWRTRKVNSGDDDRLLVVRHPVDVTRSAFGQPQTRSAGATPPSSWDKKSRGKKGKIMRMQKRGDLPCVHLWRQPWLRIALGPFVAMPSVLPVHRYCRRCGWDITARKEPREGGATSTPTLATAPTLPTLPLRRPLAGHRSHVACERVGGGLHSH